MELSSHAFAPVREAFLGTKGNTALHLETEVARSDFEDLIRPLVNETLEAIDRALADADLAPSDLDRVILVGGSTRVPLVQQMVDAHLNQKPVDGIQPDLCVALGAALQAGVLVGEDVEAILVDVIPHSLGISAVVMTPMGMMPGFFSVIIPRNSVVPVSRSQVYSTTSDNQSVVKIDVFQGENQMAEENVPLGSYKIEDIPRGAAGSIKIEVHFDFDLNGILTVTTTEKGKGQQAKLVVESSTGVQKLSSQDLNQAKHYLDSLFVEDEDEIFTELDPELAKLVEQGQKLIDTLEDEQADELQDLLDRLEEAISEEETALISQLQEELSDFLYYSTTKDS